MATEAWNLLLLSATLALAIGVLLHRRLTSTSHPRRALPPGPPPLPILGNFLFLVRNFENLSSAIGGLGATYGPAVTLYVAGVPFVYILDRRLAHEALVERASQFAHRLPPLGGSRVYSSDGHTISTAPYGSLWRLLRRNLSSGILHSARIKSCSWARERALANLVESLRSEAACGKGVVHIYDQVQSAVFRLLTLICFGDAISEETIREIIPVERDIILFSSKLVLMDLWPRAAKVFQWRTWKKILAVRRKQEAIMSPLIRARRERRKENREEVLCYVDTLVDLELPDEGGRKLTDDEIVSLCSEFINAGADTTTTVLEWTMAELIRHPELQKKLRQEIQEVDGRTGGGVREEDLEKVVYLKAVILEALRRHPPAPMVVPHTVSEDTPLDKYVIPKGALVNFTLGQMARDERVWEEPMEFRPERFMAGGEGEGVDISGNREIKMTPFGAGRRICPGMGLGMFHIEYFLANLVQEFEWKPASEGEEVDMAEKLVFTVVMKHPLRARVIARVN
ncbi:Cytochrome P450 [Canna indica]|uniref:Cytochrome P450 n=1 Tax=Canna indica TaxID=4628 RepID=A0AAQ3QM73_9LILI|nr:Cytochrome P450 [Canna indica]